MKQHSDQFDQVEMSEALGVSRSGYYRWSQGKRSARRQHDETIKSQIERICRRATGPYGYRPVRPRRA